MNSEKCLNKNSIIWWQRILPLLFTIHCLLFTAQAQVGTWQNYLAYHDVQNICEAGHQLFVLASNDIYQYNKNDQSITTYDKVNGLSDTYITHIAWCAQAKRLIAVYQNANIDLLDTNGDITNISALYSKTMTEDKTVSKITIDGVYAWLHCPFGLVKVNVQKAEIAETYTNGHPEYPTSLPEYDEFKDLQSNLTLVSSLLPGGPKYNYFYESEFYNGKLFTTGGHFLSGIAGKNYPGTVQVFDGDNWTIYEDELNLKTGYQYWDVNCISIDPTDESHIAVGGKSGLYEFRNSKLVSYYNLDNSPLKGAYDRGQQLDNNYVLVNGIKFDQQGRLWVINSQAKGVNLLVLKDGKWQDHNQNLLNDGNGVTWGGLRNMIFDSRGLLWFVNTSWVGQTVFCYNIESNQMVAYTSFVNQDGTRYSPNFVYCVAEDKEGNIWVGTDLGPFYIDKSEVGQGSVTFQQVKVPRNDGTNYADYLLSGVSVSHIAVDGGNRKWFVTNGIGAFLISADNMTQISHLSTENSPMLSDQIYSVAINHQTGVVYFLTEKGLCSYRSDATQPTQEMTKDNVYAYPNPVTPDYTGLITIVGLSYDTDVKITTSNGVLVAEGRSNGGSFTWDGKDRQGKRVASGVYMVITATSQGEKGTVCKIVIVN